MFANIEYEVDELRRDIRVCELANKEGHIVCTFVHDKCIIAPGEVRTKDGRGYTVSQRCLRFRMSLTNVIYSVGIFTLPTSVDTSPRALHTGP